MERHSPLRPRAPLNARQSDVPETGCSVMVSRFFTGGGSRAPPSPGGGPGENLFIPAPRCSPRSGQHPELVRKT